MTVAIHVGPSGLHGRLWALQCKLRRIFHDRLDLLLEFFDLGLGQVSGLNHVRRQVAYIVGPDFGQFRLRWVAELDLSDRRGYRIPRLVGLHFHGRSVRPWIGHGMTAPAISLALNELRATTIMDSIKCTACRFENLLHVHPVDLFGRDVVGGGALENEPMVLIKKETAE